MVIQKQGQWEEKGITFIPYFPGDESCSFFLLKTLNAD